MWLQNVRGCDHPKNLPMPSRRLSCKNGWGGRYWAVSPCDWQFHKMTSSVKAMKHVFHLGMNWEQPTCDEVVASLSTRWTPLELKCIYHNIMQPNYHLELPGRHWQTRMPEGFTLCGVMKNEPTWRKVSRSKVLQTNIGVAWEPRPDSTLPFNNTTFRMIVVVEEENGAMRAKMKVRKMLKFGSSRGQGINMHSIGLVDSKHEGWNDTLCRNNIARLGLEWPTSSS